MKLINVLLLIVTINFMMVIFLGISVPGSSLWTLVTHPENWSSLSLIDYIKDSLVLIGATTIIIGSIFLKNDFAVRAGFATIFLSFGVGIAEFYQYLASLSYFTDYTYLAAIFAGGLAMLYLYVVLAFWFKGE